MAKPSRSHKGNKGSTSVRSRGPKSEQLKDSGNISSNKGQKSQGIDLPESTASKKGCGTMLFTLLLPIIAVGAYLFLGS